MWLSNSSVGPKNASAVCPMSKAPSEVDNAQLEELGIAVIEDEQE